SAWLLEGKPQHCFRSPERLGTLDPDLVVDSTVFAGVGPRTTCDSADSKSRIAARGQESGRRGPEPGRSVRPIRLADQDPVRRAARAAGRPYAVAFADNPCSQP